MTPFQITFHYINHERELDVLENAFLKIKDQLELYEKQHSITLSSYLKSWQEELDTLQKTFEKVEQKAQERYKKALGTENPENQDNIAYATHISGLDYLSHKNYEDTENIKTKYFDFLDLFSKSTLIALYSLNENFLNKTCDIVSQTLNHKIKVSHFNSRDYLKASIDYLELVTDIPIAGLEKYISKLKDIQFLRNKIIHAGSQFSNDSILEISKKYPKSLHYEKEKEFLKIVKPEFINNLFKLIREFYEEILWLIEERREFKTVKNIFENWFSLIEGQISIIEIDYKKTSSKTRTITFKISSDNKNIPQQNGKLTLTRSKGYNVEIINQTNCDTFQEFVNTQMESHGIYLEQELKVFMSFDKTLDIRLLIY
jgi:hypothetical protein